MTGKRVSRQWNEPTKAWKPLVFVDLRVPCLEYAAAAEIDMLRMSDDDQLAIDDLISLLERFGSTPSAPKLGLEGEVSMEKLPVYRIRLENAHRELEKRNALLTKAQARHAEDKEIITQLREDFLKENENLRNQLSIQKRNPNYLGQDVEFMPTKGGAKSRDSVLESELEFWRDQVDEMRARIRALESSLKKSQSQVSDLIKKLQGYDGSQLANWLRGDVQLTDQRASELVEALGGVQVTSETINDPDPAGECRKDIDVPKVDVERSVENSIVDTSKSISTTSKEKEEVNRLRRMVDNMVRFERAARMAKCTPQQMSKGWTTHELDLGELAKMPDVYLQAVSDNQDFLDDPALGNPKVDDDHEFLQETASLRPKCLLYHEPLLEPKDVTNWPSIDPKAWLLNIGEDMEDVPHPCSNNEPADVQHDVRPPRTFAPTMSTQSRPDDVAGELNERQKSKTPSTEVQADDVEPVSRNVVKRHAEISEPMFDDALLDRLDRTMPKTCPYCGRDLLEPLPFDYTPWRYHKSLSAFKRPADIDVAAFVRAALARRAKVKVFDRLFYKRFNEPWQRRRGPLQSSSPTVVQDQCRLQDSLVKPDRLSLMDTTTTASGALASTLKFAETRTTGDLTSITSTTKAVGVVKTLDLFGDANGPPNNESRRKVWEFESEGAPPSVPSRSSNGKASNAKLKCLENNNVSDSAPCAPPVPTLDARWKPLAPLQLTHECKPAKFLQVGAKKQEDAPLDAVRPASSDRHGRRRHPAPEEQRIEASRSLLEALWQQRHVLDCSGEDLDHSTNPQGKVLGTHAASNGGCTIRSVLDGRVQPDPRSILRPKKALARCGSAPNVQRCTSRS